MHQTNNISSIQLFSEFFHENQEKFLSFAYSYIRDRQEAEDILMESMITLWENRDKWEEDSNLHGLLLTIIKNKALNYLAHLQVRLRAEEEINSHSQRELDLRISTLEACEPDAIFDTAYRTESIETYAEPKPADFYIEPLSKYSEQKDSGTTRHFRQKCGVPHHQSIENSAYRTERLPGFYSFLKIIAFFVRVVQG